MAIRGRARSVVYIFHQFVGAAPAQNIGGIYTHVRNYSKVNGFKPVIVGLSDTSKSFRRGRAFYLSRRLKYGPILVQYAVAMIFNLRLYLIIRNRRVSFFERAETATLLWGRKRRYILTIHGIGFSGSSSLKKLCYKFMESVAIRRSFHTFVVDPLREKEMQGRGHLNLSFTPTSFDPDVFNWRPLPPFDRIRLGYAGRKSPEKQLFLFGPVLKALSDKHCVELVNAGSAEWADFDAVESERIKFKNYGRVPSSDMMTFYAACHIVLLTSRFEGYPLQLIEALGCGRPFVAPSHPGIVDIANRCLGGTVYSFSDPELSLVIARMIAEKFEALREQAGLSEKIALEARVFSLHNVLRVYEKKVLEMG